jgi:hypothetical protein
MIMVPGVGLELLHPRRFHPHHPIFYFKGRFSKMFIIKAEFSI